MHTEMASGNSALVKNVTVNTIKRSKVSYGEVFYVSFRILSHVLFTNWTFCRFHFFQCKILQVLIWTNCISPVILGPFMGTQTIKSDLVFCSKTNEIIWTTDISWIKRRRDQLIKNYLDKLQQRSGIGPTSSRKKSGYTRAKPINPTTPDHITQPPWVPNPPAEVIPDRFRELDLFVLRPDCPAMPECWE